MGDIYPLKNPYRYLGYGGALVGGLTGNVVGLGTNLYFRKKGTQLKQKLNNKKINYSGKDLSSDFINSSIGAIPIIGTIPNIIAAKRYYDLYDEYSKRKIRQ
jgi:hypothetical protein